YSMPVYLGASLITFSARIITTGGIVRPRALAVFRLITNSNLVGCSTGRSAGLVPLRILSIINAIRRRVRWGRPRKTSSHRFLQILSERKSPATDILPPGPRSVLGYEWPRGSASRRERRYGP